ncbi:MAG: class I SAM-dependent methyltransferase [Opitutales bacterium]
MAVDGCKHHANRRVWESWAPRWSEATERRALWKRALNEPSCVLGACELAYLGPIEGLRVAVLGSGDNEAAFALVGLGARVTSVDVAQGQLDAARQRATSVGVEMEFVRADVTDLSALADASFDLVYTGGHVAVWVSDLPLYYREAGRILRPSGRFLVNEYHPIRRIWRERADRLEIERSYFDRAPAMYETDSAAAKSTVGTFLNYQFHYTVADYYRSVQFAGCTVEALEEWSDHTEPWEHAPLKGLPHWLMLGARKTGAAIPITPSATTVTESYRRGIFARNME